MGVPSDVKASLALAREMRQPWEGRWQELTEIAMPYRTHLWSNIEGSQGQSQGTVYDETGMVGVDEMANRLQSGIMPEGIEWALLEADEDVTDEFRAGLAQVQRYMFRVLSRSNHSVEMNDGLPDLCGYGNICLDLLPGPPEKLLQFQAIPLPDVWITPGLRGAWGDIHVRHRMRGYAVAAEYPGSCPDAVKAAPTRMYAVMDSWLRDMGARGEVWRQTVHIEGMDDVLSMQDHSGSGSCRYLFSRWKRGAGELYGTGQGMFALPSMRTLNEITRLIMAHGELALSGMWQAEDDGVINPWSVRLEPGAIVPIAMGSQGLRPLQMPSTRLDIGQLVLNEQRHAIRKALYNETLGAREGTPPTAFEIEERMAELARQIGPAYSRVWSELVVPLMVRIRRIMDRRGLVKMPEIDGQKIKVSSASALVRSAQAAEVRRVDQWMSGIAAHYGPQAVPSLVPADRYMRFTQERLNIPANLPFAPAEMRANAQRIGSLLGAAQGAGVDMAPMLAALGVGGGRAAG
jgi:hypothetical protein